MTEGIFLFNKPAGISSAGFLNEIKKELREKDLLDRKTKVGHGGTLDPFANGLMVVAFSREYTKRLDEVLKGKNKGYWAEVILGYSSDTYDRTGSIKKNDIKNFSHAEEIKKALDKLKSKKEQMPPQFSALKISGSPAYKMARRGEVVDLKPRPVSLNDFHIIKIDYYIDKIILDILVDVSSGFYVRSLANDLGDELGMGGYLNKLTRYKIGEFYLKDALSINKFIEAASFSNKSVKNKI